MLRREIDCALELRDGFRGNFVPESIERISKDVRCIMMIGYMGYD